MSGDCPASPTGAGAKNRPAPRTTTGTCTSPRGVDIPADGEVPLVGAVDGRVFGSLIYSRMQGSGDVYLLADFVVNSTRYRRLAKLLLLVTQTREVRPLLEEKFLLEISKCRTTE